MFISVHPWFLFSPRGEFRPRRCHGLLTSALLLATSALLRAQQAPPMDTEDIRGPKPMVEIPVVPKTDWVFWVSFGVGVLLVLLIWFIWNKLADRKKASSPREIALSALRVLEGQRRELSADAFANNAAQTVRQYIASRFGIAAPRRTTEEFLRDLAKDPTSPLSGETEQLKTFLKSCDLAKFAGADLDELRRDELVLAARGFILAAAPVDTSAAPVRPAVPVNPQPPATP